MWDELWDIAEGWREDLFRDAIDLWGTTLLHKARGPLPLETKAEVACFEWVWKRRRWLFNMKWCEIDRWILRHFEQAGKLPLGWSFVGLIKEALKRKMGLLEVGQ